VWRKTWVSRSLCDFFSHWHLSPTQDHTRRQRRFPDPHRSGPLVRDAVQRQLSPPAYATRRAGGASGPWPPSAPAPETGATALRAFPGTSCKLVRTFGPMQSCPWGGGALGLRPPPAMRPQDSFGGALILEQCSPPGSGLCGVPGHLLLLGIVVDDNQSQ
jgi:hypothetical protein